MNQCEIEECTNRAVTRGWCPKHYARWQRTGDPLRLLKPGGLCSLEGCGKKNWARRYCRNHYRLFMLYGDPLGGPGKGSVKQDAVDRFWSKVDKSGPIPQHRPHLGACWVWTASLRQGYGSFWVDGTTTTAHLFAYRTFVGDSSGLQVDHLCRVRNCVRISHLEAVTPKENNRRSTSPSARNAVKTHCRNGHEYTGITTYTDKKGRRSCRICNAAATIRYHQRLLEKAGLS